MPAIIDSAPSCIQAVQGATEGDDADFILQAAYEKCAGIMTFGPGTVYGEDGAAAATGYYVLSYLGLAVMIVALVAWVLFEHRRLTSHAQRLGARDGGGTPPAVEA
jgi:hypothetical protein